MENPLAVEKLIWMVLGSIFVGAVAAIIAHLIWP
jgi:hypothetical protein